MFRQLVIALVPGASAQAISRDEHLFIASSISTAFEENPVRILTNVLFGCGLFLATALPANAQTFPTKPIQIIVTAPAGGALDILTRSVGQKLQERLGQPVIVENRPGAAGSLGTAIGAKAPADGYTLTLVYSSHSINPHLYASLPYDTLKDFSPVVLMASLPMGLFVNPSVPAKSVSEFVALAKANPGKINYGSSGNGSVSHILGAMFTSATSTELIHVPYRGSVPAKTDLLAGRVQAMFADVDVVQQNIKSGQLRALALATDSRLQGYEDIPTFAEAGVNGLVVASQVGLIVPANTPPDVVNKLNREIVAILKDPEMAQRVRDRGMTVVASTPAEYDKVIRDDYARFGEIIRKANIKMD
ncbi:MAG: tripartite tricarboxylate transporter substrate binding protein [Burkholderiales bacterium]